MRHLILLAALLAGCAPFTPSATVPGASSYSFSSPWVWERQATPDPEFVATLDQLKTPEDIAAWLQANIEWRDDFDTRRFMAPGATFKERRTVCTGFARFWIYALGRLGIKAEFLAIWAPEGAHAVVVARINGQYRLFSNQYYYSDPGQSLGYDRDQAFAAASAEFYGQRWNTWEWWLDTGQRLDKAVIERGVTPLSPMQATPGRNIFTIKR